MPHIVGLITPSPFRLVCQYPVLPTSLSLVRILGFVSEFSITSDRMSCDSYRLADLTYKFISLARKSGVNLQELL
jgi:hypothetical protein